ncbi:MAG: hypothetical protein ABSD56_01605 [Bryobacteraceae bacterium]|jgi:hypothetical protein
MANEINVTASLAYSNATASILGKLLAWLNKPFTISGVNLVVATFSVPTVSGGGPAALPGLDVLTTVGWAAFVNHDPTNYVDLMTAVAGVAFARLLPGECAVFRLPAAMVAPAALAHTADCLIEYLILEN